MEMSWKIISSSVGTPIKVFHIDTQNLPINTSTTSIQNLSACEIVIHVAPSGCYLVKYRP